MTSHRLKDNFDGRPESPEKKKFMNFTGKCKINKRLVIGAWVDEWIDDGMGRLSQWKSFNGLRII